MAKWWMSDVVSQSRSFSHFRVKAAKRFKHWSCTSFFVLCLHFFSKAAGDLSNLY